MEFDFEHKHIGEARKTIFINAAVRAKRCHKCEEIYFVNDMHNEFTICSHCRGTANKIETRATQEDRMIYE